MDVLILNTFLSPMLTVATVWNTGETGDINSRLVCLQMSVIQIPLYYLIVGDQAEFHSQLGRGVLRGNFWGEQHQAKVVQLRKSWRQNFKVLLPWPDYRKRELSESAKLHFDFSAEILPTRPNPECQMCECSADLFDEILQSLSTPYSFLNCPIYSSWLLLLETPLSSCV